MKKYLSLLLAVCMVLALCACGQKETTAPAATQQIPAQGAVAASDPSTVESQLNLIFQNMGMLRADEAGRSFWYTITDLDHNGRLEFTAAITEGTSNSTTANMYEVNSAFTGLEPVSLGLSANQYLPEIIVKSTDVYKDSNNVYNYVYTDTDSAALMNGGHYITKIGLSLSNSTVNLTPIAYQDISYLNGYTVYTFYDSKGTEQDPASFDIDEAADDFYDGAAKSTQAFDWFSLAEVTNVNRLVQSYNVFAGTAQPTEPAQTPIPAPTQTIKIIDVSNPQVTKNPTSESVTAGGSCMFVAQAIGYNYMKWQWVSPQGTVYDVASYNPFPATLNTYGSTSQTLTLSGIPYDLNGWQVQAVFTGDTESVTSGRATIYVSKAPTPSYVTISFSPASGTTFNSVQQWVTVYSSTGENIHVECTQSGNSGAYYSDTIASGQSFPVNGVAGQVVSVTVYASCGNSAAVNAVYYVDCSPVTPTPQPQQGYTKYGTVTSCDGTWATISFGDGTAGTYNIGSMVSNPPVGGESCCCNFDANGTLISFHYDRGEFS